MSKHFQILAGVRQGGVLSPTLFAVFIDSIISKLCAAGYGASVAKYLFGCLAYVDNAVLVSHSFATMQLMLDIHCREAEAMDFVFDTTKLVALCVGSRYKCLCCIYPKWVTNKIYKSSQILRRNVSLCTYIQIFVWSF